MDPWNRTGTQPRKSKNRQALEAAVLNAVRNDNIFLATALVLRESSARTFYRGRDDLSILGDWALRNGHSRTLHYLAQKGLEVRSVRPRDFIFSAAEIGRPQVIKALLDHGIDIETRDWKDATALSNAAQYGRVSIIKLLLNEGANIETTDKNNETPLIHAIDNCRFGAVRLLLQRGANPNTSGYKGQSPPLRCAVKYEKAMYGAQTECRRIGVVKDMMHFETVVVVQTEIVRALLEHGASVATISGFQRKTSALHWAAATNENSLPMIRLLVEYGANLEDRDETGATALHLAADNKGETPLHAAVEQLEPSNTTFLLENGASTKHTDLSGQTVADYARSRIKTDGQCERILRDQIEKWDRIASQMEAL